MMKQHFITLHNRAIISVSGEDRKVFLQGLITNDINKVSETQAIYAFMLSPVGRFLYDFFIIQRDGELLLDCCKEKVDEIVQKLSFYKLRSKVEIRKEDLVVEVSIGSETCLQDGISFIDPRNGKVGVRNFSDSLSFKNIPTTLNMASSGVDTLKYNFNRLNLKLPDDSDLTFNKSFPLEFGFDNFNAIDYHKGCYIGQETTARTHYKGTIRKKIFLVEILDCKRIEKGTEIESEDKKIGEILSSIFWQNQLLALALIKNLDNEGKEINFEKLKLIVARNATNEIEKGIKIIK